MNKWNKMNKTKAVLLHLIKYGYIDTFIANKLYNATRLSSIIHNLRNIYGLNIITEMIPFTDSYGTSSSYGKYVLIKDADYYDIFVKEYNDLFIENVDYIANIKEN